MLLQSPRSLGGLTFFMKNYMNAVKVTENVWWVGAIDWNIRNFHGYSTTCGTTYNAFLVFDEHVTLIDTVKAPFFEEMYARIISVLPDGKIDYLVSLHSEMDHSGSIPRAVAAMRPDRIFASPMGVKTLGDHFGKSLQIESLATGDKLSLGSETLSFVETKMLHWPDSMAAYLDKAKILFSQDAFGMHLASSELFADKLPAWQLETEAKKYFANILLLQAPKIIALLDTLPTLNFDINIIAPDHGPLWRGEDCATPLANYRQWALQEKKERAMVVYDSMWGSTAVMAKTIAEAFREAGLPVDIYNMQSCNRSEIMTAVMDAGLIAVGSPTMNNQLYPTLADVMTYMKGLKPKNMTGIAFGSFGWSGEAAKNLHSLMTDMGFNMPLPGPLAIKYVPAAEALENLYEQAKKVAEDLWNK